MGKCNSQLEMQIANKSIKKILLLINKKRANTLKNSGLVECRQRGTLTSDGAAKWYNLFSWYFSKC